MAGGSGQIRAGRAFVEFATQGQDSIRRAFVKVQASFKQFSRTIDMVSGIYMTKFRRNLRYAEIQLTRFARRLRRSVNRAVLSGFRSLNTMVGQLGSRLMAMGKYAALALGALAGATMVKAINAASDFGETVNKFEVVFGDNAKAMRAWAEEFAQSVGRSKREVLDFMATSKSFLVPMGIDEAQANRMSQVLAQLSFDLGSFHNIADDEAFEKLRAGLSGEAEPLKELGVVLNEAALKAELLKQGLNPATATEAQKVMARYNIILASTTTAQGDAERTSESFANKVKALQAAWEDFLVIVGEKLVPYATVLVDWLTKLLRANSEVSGSVDGASESLEGMANSSGFAVTALGWLLKGWHMLNAVIKTGQAVIQGFFGLLLNLARFVASSSIFDKVFGAEAMEPLRAGIAEAERYLTTEAQKALEDAGRSLDVLDDENVGADFLAGFTSSMERASADLKKAADEANASVAVPFEAISNFGPVIEKAKKVAEQIEVVSPESLEGMAAYEQFRENNRLKETALLAKAAEALKKAIESPVIALATVE